VLRAESGQAPCVLGYFIGQEFQGNEAMQLHVLGFVDNTHPAAAEFFCDVIVGDGLVDHQWRKNIVQS
jgi:hypothetical protein